MSIIEKVHAREVFDSRGKPTVEVEIHCEGGAWGRSLVPSGASTGKFEALELRDRDDQRLAGQGVLNAVNHVNHEINEAICGLNVVDLVHVDHLLLQLDGTPNKGRLGANAILGTSLAAAHAGAAATRSTLVEHLASCFNKAYPETKAEAPFTIPQPMVNMISGGQHAGENIDFQDFLIMPVGMGSFKEAFTAIVEIYWVLGKLLLKAGYEGYLVGDEGGYGPKLDSNEQALQFVIQAIKEAGFEPGRDFGIAIDVASTEFYRAGRYHLKTEGGAELTSDEMVDKLVDWCERYPVLSIEDGLDEEDWSGWQKLTKKLGSRVQLIGDDLFVTNATRLQKGIDLKAGNAVLVKVNQIGSLTETFQTLSLAKQAEFGTVVSARSGETEDATIADLAIATNAGQIKIGSVARSERLAKYNQLIRLEETMGQQTNYRSALSFND